MMQQLELHYEKPLKGEFNLKELNFLFVFQVNCPGCFIYGIPTVNSLFNSFKNEVSFLGLSTAFEDFEFNTVEHTHQLINKGETVGETKRYFENQGYLNYPISLDFPIAMDRIADESFDLEDAALKISNTNPNYQYWPAFEQKNLRQNVLQYLTSQEKISLTFTLNQMKGTPTFMVFNQDMKILIHHFGHQSVSQLKLELKELLLQSN